MNNLNRQELRKAIDYLQRAHEIIDSLKESEREKFDNLNEGLQAAEAGQKLEQNADSLDYIYDDLDGMIDSINEIIGG